MGRWGAFLASPVVRHHLVTMVVMSLACLALWWLDLLPRQDPQPGRKERARVVGVAEKKDGKYIIDHWEY